MKEYRSDTKELDKLIERWPSAMVARAELHKFTGGILNGRTEANKESRRDADALRPFRVGRKIFYDVSNVTETIKQRMAAAV